MLRLYFLGALLVALGSLALGGFSAYHASVETAFKRGHAAGVAELTLQLDQKWEAERKASAALVADANHQVSLLEQDRADLELQYDGLKNAISAKIVPNSGGNHSCLDARLVRLLNDIGTRAPGSGGSP